MKSPPSLAPAIVGLMDGKVYSHKDLVVWQKAVRLASRVYVATSRFPVEEKFGLTSQLRRATLSIVSNITEGSARRTTREFVHFLHIARGSLAEAEVQMQIASELKWVGADDSLLNDIAEVGRLLNGLIRSLRRPRQPPRA